MIEGMASASALSTTPLMLRVWKQVVATGEAPKPVYLHSAVQHGNQMIVFGGNNGKECNDLFYYNLSTSVWRRAVVPGGLMMAGNYPSARYGHSSCVYGSGAGFLLIVGGCKSNNSYYKDAWCMDMNTNAWRKLEDLPLDLAYHSLFTWQERAYLFGGYNGKTFLQHMYVLDGLTGKWTAVQVQGQAPPPMCGAAVVLQGNELFVFGGYTERGHTNELYRFEMRTSTWTLLPTSNKPLSRAYLQAAVVGQQCSIFGGYDGTTCISDFRSIQLPHPVGSNAASLGHNPFASPDLYQLPVPAQVEVVLSTFGYNDTLNRAQLHNLLTQLGVAVKDMSARRNSNSGLNSGGANSYPFDATLLPQLVGLGFAKDLVVKVLTRMHAEGKNLRNIDLVADTCLREDTPAPPAHNAAQLERQASERENLKKQVQQLKDASEENQQCKICFDRSINCALNPCGHLCVCTTCAQSLIGDSNPCPICQAKIQSILKIYWT